MEENGSQYSAAGAMAIAGAEHAGCVYRLTMAPNAADLFTELQSSGFRDLAGTQVSARVPIAAALLNRIVADALRGNTAVRRVEVQPLDGDRFNVVVAVKWTLVPPITIGVAVERQPELPASPVLVLRWSLGAGLGAIASQFAGSFNQRLPPGVRLDGEHVLIDVSVLAANTPGAQVLPYLTALRLHTVEGRAVLEMELRVGS
jgi:hypothetical protein